jgi:hypothetical protein
VPLSSGTRLGPYEIQAAIGAGGMGEVYSARDTRLDRIVAIKVLPTELSADPERRARFEREAKTIAGLNHPHICTLHDVGQQNGSIYLVMEHLAGETLADRLRRGALPVAQALEFGAQIADALGAAHKHGVIHRDLKPANVMLTKAGAARQGSPQAKLLDFGLAKLKGHGETPAAGSLASLPTRSVPLTAEGTIVGTLQYMAPEQVEGKEADARTDLWALGAILYEMLTGRRAFEGASAASLIGDIMNTEPPALPSLQPLTPSLLDRLVRRCLAKDRDARWQSASDVADELRWLREDSGQAAALPQAPSRQRRVRGAVAMIVVGLAGALMAVGVLWLLGAVTVAPVHVVRSVLPVRPAEEVAGGGSAGAWHPTPGGSRLALAWTPDGQSLLFIGWRVAAAAETALAETSTDHKGLLSRVYVRELDRPEAHALPGTEGARGPATLSPDGLSVAFWRASAIHRVPLRGGPVTVLAEPVPRVSARIAWGRSGLVVFDGSPDGRLWQFTGQGAPTPLTTLREGEVVDGLPQLIDQDRVLMYTVRRDRTVWGEEEVVAQVLSTGERTRIVAQAADARLLPTGHLAFLRRGVLWAVPFDASRRVAIGEPVAVEESVAQALAGDNDTEQTGVGQLDVSVTGTLAYIPGALPSYPDQALVRIDRAGRTTELAAPHGPYLALVRRAGTGPFLYADQLTLTEHSIWRHDLSHPGSLTKVAPGFVDSFAVSPDGRGIAYGTVRDGMQVVAWQQAEGVPPETLARGSLRPVSWTPDGRYLFLVAPESRIWVYALEGTEPHLRPLSEGASHEEAPEVSPDGRWLAFVSDETRRFEVYVRPFPGPGPKTQVTVEGGNSLAWSPDGSELLFVSSTLTAKSCPTGPMCMNVVPLDLSHGPRVGTARRLFDFSNRELGLNCTPTRCYDVAEDGVGSYAIKSVQPPRPRPIVTHINIVENWFEELKVEVPTTR